MSEYKLAVFDMAGTTVEEGGSVYRTLKESVVDQGFPVTDEKLSQIAGMNKYEAITYLLPESAAGDKQLTDAIFEDFKQRLDQIYLEDPSVTEKPGISTLFEKLQEMGIRVALNTGYARPQANILIERLDWGKRIDDSITSDEVAHGRPQPDMIHALMKRAGVKHSSEVIKVGDTVNDVREGRKAECGLVVAVLGGAHDEATLKAYEPDVILDNTADLVAYLMASKANPLG